MTILSLADALKEGRINEFIAQEEARGIGPIDLDAFNALTATLIKAPQSEDQTLRSPSGDNSTGRRTRQGNDRRNPR